MKLVRYQEVNRTAWGLLEDGCIYSLSGSISENFKKGARVAPREELVLLPPCQPAKVIALAYNYKDLVGFRETYDEPLIFFKSPAGVISWVDPIVIPSNIRQVWIEVELAFVVKKRAKNIPEDRAGDYILGYTIANDVTAGNIHGRDHHLARSKGLDTFCPVGQFLETELNTGNLELKTVINGKETQRSRTSNRILNDRETLSLVSRFITLEAGDLVLTGTPAGAMDSRIQPGDRVLQEIEGLGTLENQVVTREICPD